MKLLEFAFEASKRILEIAAALLLAVMRAVMALIGTICRFLGIQPPSMPQLPQPSTTPDDVRDEYTDSFAREVESDHALASDIGMSVHQYASALDPSIRGAVDISGLSAEQTDWLLRLREEDLQRLVAAGPKACELAASGRKCGVVGLPVPPAVHQEIEGPNPVRNLLVDRIRANARRPHPVA